MPGNPPRPTGDHVGVEYLATRSGVQVGTARKWCHQGKVFAERRGTVWWIPKSDADAFLAGYARYGRVRGRVLDPIIPGKGRRYPYRPKAATAAVARQSIKIDLPAGILHHLDAERRSRPDAPGRTTVIIEALRERYGILPEDSLSVIGSKE